jgi:hypothetical protein
LKEDRLALRRRHLALPGRLGEHHRRAQRLTGYACLAFGVLLLMVGINAMLSFIRPGGLLRGVLY